MFFTPKNAELLECKDCYFKCFKKSDWERHITTQKHFHRTKHLNLEPKSAENEKIFVCKFCQKSYKARNSLWYHEKKCEFITEKSSNKSDENVIISSGQQTDIQALTGLIFEMVKSNIDVGLAMADIRDKFDDIGIMLG
jgi:hypothetical protein